jgi:hypothetical protein
MTTPLDPLLTPTDFARFQAKDQDWFLGAVGDTIRDFCGWHIFPVISTTGYHARIGNKGIIMLPTRNLLSVEQVVYQDPYALDASMFEVHPEGFLRYRAMLGRRGRNLEVVVDFTHGYEELPKPVAEVGFELTATVLEKPAGVVTDMTRGPSRMSFKEFGAVLSDDQKARLGPYTLVRV